MKKTIKRSDKINKGYQALQLGLENGTIFFDRLSRSFIGEASDGTRIEIGSVFESTFAYLADHPTPDKW